PSFASALRASLRQDPDVILVGEMRDLETISTALHAAETGHLVFSTLHTPGETRRWSRSRAGVRSPDLNGLRARVHHDSGKDAHDPRSHCCRYFAVRN